MLLLFFSFCSDPSGQILRVCDQINQQGLHLDQQPAQTGNIPDPTFSGSVTNIVQPHNMNPNFQPNFQPIPIVQQQQQQQLQQPQQQPFSSTSTINQFNFLLHKIY